MTDLTVYPTNPSSGPVHVDAGAPLCHPDTRNVPDSPHIQALIDAGHLAVVDAPTGKSDRPARRSRQETT